MSEEQQPIARSQATPRRRTMKLKAFIQRHPTTTYFGIALLVPFVGFLTVMLPRLLRGEAIQSMDALILYPIMELGVFLAGIILTRVVDGKSGLRDLFARMGHWRVNAGWYAAVLLIPSCVLLVVLLTLKTTVAPLFSPGLHLDGIAYGLVSGFFEETGWTGYAFPKLRLQYNALTASIILGGLWGLWHMAVVDQLGAAGSHGIYWLPFFLSFVAILMAIRVLIGWVYSNTRSVLLAQLMHASLTGSLVMFSPVPISPANETLWYAVYAVALWVVVALVIIAYGKCFVRQALQGKAV